MNKVKRILFSIICLSAIAPVVSAEGVTDSIPGSIKLDEIVVATDRNRIVKKDIILESVEADAHYLDLNRGSSLMNSLEKIPGVKSMQVGQGFSKPMIRGLGFNRVAVVQNGVKQQGQQWGADHGLEIDQYDVENIEIYKGAASLQFGSDAIAGVIKILPWSASGKDGYESQLMLNGASSNMLFGGSFDNRIQKGGKYAKARVTYQNFESYRVPTSSFEYLGWRYPIYNHRLKNTAGRELDASLQMGVKRDNGSSDLLVSNVYAKTGFFAGAHGKPTEVNLQDDGKYRHIGLPYQRVNHFKAVYNQHMKIDSKHHINFDLGYQNNNRKEFSKPHTSGINSELELELKLQTFSGNAMWENQLSHQSRISVGINGEYQHNGIGGFSFLLPRFNQFTTGVYVINRYRFSDKMVFMAGARYDWGRIRVFEFIDPYLSGQYKVRAENLRKHLSDYSFSAGLSYDMNREINMRFNIGKSFRMPTANELSSNGVHHGTFRHELGDPHLNAEKSYQIDYAIDYKRNLDGFFNSMKLTTSLFTNYFPNFIFLNPTGQFSWLPDAGQYYKYEQSKAFRSGGEVSLELTFAHQFTFSSSFDYVYAQDLDNKYPIPFTPPFSLNNDISINIGKIGFMPHSRVSVGHRFTAAQNRVARNELKTPSYNLFDASIQMHVPFNKSELKIILQGQNLLNKKYYNHLSFYRNIDIPEIGRNFRLSVQIPLVN